MHFKYLFLAAVLGLATLLVAEFGYKQRWWRGEGARKLVHMFVGLQVAVWPLYLDWNEIRMISIVLFVGFVVCMRFKLFQSIGSVARLTYGEILFTLVIGALTLVTQSAAIYAAAMLHLSLADGMAALVGTRYGRMTSYQVFGFTKSVVGSLTFFIISVGILTAYALLSPHGLSWQLVLVGATLATFLENIGVLGTDNLLVPGGIVALLTYAK